MKNWFTSFLQFAGKEGFWIFVIVLGGGLFLDSIWLTVLPVLAILLITTFISRKQ